jgi:hypothetical protein
MKIYLSFPISNSGTIFARAYTGRKDIRAHWTYSVRAEMGVYSIYKDEEFLSSVPFLTMINNAVMEDLRGMGYKVTLY